ncbi:hypothetical protein OF83DRAFT_1169295 [Amylostereum chailletii]|nr:hypothetical protein OF83DRAFT_1169295 [Amylostereum chailletii]
MSSSTTSSTPDIAALSLSSQSVQRPHDSYDYDGNSSGNVKPHYHFSTSPPISAQSAYSPLSMNASPLKNKPARGGLPSSVDPASLSNVQTRRLLAHFFYLNDNASPSASDRPSSRGRPPPSTGKTQVHTAVRPASGVFATVYGAPRARRTIKTTYTGCDGDGGDADTDDATKHCRDNAITVTIADTRAMGSFTDDIGGGGSKWDTACTDACGDGGGGSAMSY